MALKGVLAFCVALAKCDVGERVDLYNSSQLAGETLETFLNQTFRRIAYDTEPSYPRFTSAADIKAKGWDTYFLKMYSEIPSTGYPLSLKNFWMFREDILPNNHGLPALVGDCPTAPYTRYKKNTIYQRHIFSWVWHPPPYSAFNSGQWIEVDHEHDPFGDEHYGAWLMHMKGSGIWFHLGTTIAFSEHSQGFAKFAQGNEAMCQAAAKKGYDSIQFLAHRDPVQYPCDDKHVAGGPPYLNIEIVCTACVGTYPCMGKNGAPSSIRRGWKSDHQPPHECKCDNSKVRLNCQGVEDVLVV